MTKIFRIQNNGNLFFLALGTSLLNKISLLIIRILLTYYVSSALAAAYYTPLSAHRPQHTGTPAWPKICGYLWSYSFWLKTGFKRKWLSVSVSVSVVRQLSKECTVFGLALILHSSMNDLQPWYCNCYLFTFVQNTQLYLLPWCSSGQFPR